MVLSSRMRILAMALAGHAFAFMAGQAGAEDDILWPQKPIRIDRSKQTYERLPPIQTAIDTRTWLSIPQQITVIDGVSFTASGKTYRFSEVHGISIKRICKDADGSRFTCGRMASVVINNLVRGKRLLCNVAEGEKAVLLDHCALGNKDIATEIIAAGLGKAVDGTGLHEVQRMAMRKQAGLWRNPACRDDFDGC